MTTSAKTGPGYYWGACISNMSPVDAFFYNGVDATGKLMWVGRYVPAGGGGSTLSPPSPLRFDVGLFLEVSATPSKMVILYSP